MKSQSWTKCQGLSPALSPAASGGSSFLGPQQGSSWAEEGDCMGRSTPAGLIPASAPRSWLAALESRVLTSALASQQGCMGNVCHCPAWFACASCAGGLQLQAAPALLKSCSECSTGLDSCIGCILLGLAVIGSLLFAALPAWPEAVPRWSRARPVQPPDRLVCLWGSGCISCAVCRKLFLPGRSHILPG